MTKNLLSNISVYISSCTLSNEPDLLRATIKAGLIARFFAIYRVDNVFIYEPSPSNPCKDQGAILKTILEYARTPPYLKKLVFSKRRELKYAGLIPPLQIPTHLVSTFPVAGEYREGFITRVDKRKVLLDIGLPKLVEIEKDNEKILKKIKNLSSKNSDKLLLVKVVSTDPLKVVIVDKPEIYTGYKVSSVRYLREAVDSIRNKSYIIGTSRKGRPIWKFTGSFLNGVLKYGGSIAIFFGEPYRGLYEMLAQDYGLDAEEFFDDIFNFVPKQGTKTIRTEEAIPAVLQTIRLIERQYG